MPLILRLLNLPPESEEQVWLVLYLALVTFGIFLFAYWWDNRDTRGKMPKGLNRWPRW